MHWLNQSIGREWNITPAGGLTGDAYYAENGDRRLFLKRNSSPFLAVLSAQKIVPKLLWTKRLDNGDVITAQDWVEGRKLSVNEMQHQQVASLLYKIHHSSELLHLLMRLGKRPVTADERLVILRGKLAHKRPILKNAAIKRALDLLGLLLPATRDQKKVVCHCDVNHHNFLLTEEGQLYLIDWDNAMIADPVMDFGMLLKWYVPVKEWDTWLSRYGLKQNQALIKRMYWYLIHQVLTYLCWHDERNEATKVEECLKDLHELNQQVMMTIIHL